MKLSVRFPTTLRCALLTLLVLATREARAADPTTADCLSANDNSIALRGQHKLRAARSELLVCAAANCPADIRNECARRVAEVNSSMPTIVFEAKDAQGNDLSGVKVTMDGQVLVDRLEGTALSIDPGEHAFVFESAGLAPVQKQFIIREGEKDRRERIAFGAAAAALPAAPVAAGPAYAVAGAGTGLPPGPSAAPVQGDAPPPAPRHTKRIVGYVVGAVGLGALGVALYEQITAKDRDSSSQDASKSSSAGVRGTVHQLHEQATQAQTYAIISGAIGVAAVGTGLYLILSSSSGAAPAAQAGNRTWHVVPAVGLAGGGVLVERNW